MKYTIDRYQTAFACPLCVCLPLDNGEAAAEAREVGFTRQFQFGKVALYTM